MKAPPGARGAHLAVIIDAQGVVNAKESSQEAQRAHKALSFRIA